MHLNPHGFRGRSVRPCVPRIARVSPQREAKRPALRTHIHEHLKRFGFNLFHAANGNLGDLRDDRGHNPPHPAALW